MPRTGRRAEQIEPGHAMRPAGSQQAGQSLVERPRPARCRRSQWRHGAASARSAPTRSPRCSPIPPTVAREQLGVAAGCELELLPRRDQQPEREDVAAERPGRPVVLAVDVGWRSRRPTVTCWVPGTTGSIQPAGTSSASSCFEGAPRAGGDGPHPSRSKPLHGGGVDDEAVEPLSGVAVAAPHPARDRSSGNVGGAHRPPRAVPRRYRRATSVGGHPGAAAPPRQHRAGALAASGIGGEHRGVSTAACTAEGEQDQPGEGKLRPADDRSSSVSSGASPPPARTMAP